MIRRPWLEIVFETICLFINGERRRPGDIKTASGIYVAELVTRSLRSGAVEGRKYGRFGITKKKLYAANDGVVHNSRADLRDEDDDEREQMGRRRDVYPIRSSNGA